MKTTTWSSRSPPPCASISRRCRGASRLTLPTYNDEHRTTATINSMLMNTLIPKGVDVDRLNLPFIERVCGRYFRKVGQRWYLRGEAVGSDGTSSRLIQEEVAVKD